MGLSIFLMLQCGVGECKYVQTLELPGAVYLQKAVGHSDLRRTIKQAGWAVTEDGVTACPVCVRADPSLAKASKRQMAVQSYGEWIEGLEK